MPRSKSSIKNSVESTRLFKDAEPHVYSTLSDGQVKILAERILKNEIFTDHHVREQDLVPRIFMTVAFIGNDPEACGAFKKNPPGMIYAEMKDAAPRSINGYPMFFSCSFLSQKDTERVFAVYRAMTEALDSIGESK